MFSRAGEQRIQPEQQSLAYSSSHVPQPRRCKVVDGAAVRRECAGAEELCV